jgi:hypothetical protein
MLLLFASIKCYRREFGESGEFKHFSRLMQNKVGLVMLLACVASHMFISKEIDGAP